MGKMVRKEHFTMAVDYTNVPPTTTPAPGPNYYKGLVLAFGLLCLLQAGLNVSLRIGGHYSGKTPDIDINCKNESADMKMKLDLLDEYFQQGWLYFRPSLYYMSSVQQSWLDSRNFCVGRGADLVVINSTEEQRFINKFAKTAWIGLHQREDNGEWVWVDGTPLTRSFWTPGEPNNINGTENCTEIKKHSRIKSWNDAHCRLKNFWICEKNISFL